MGTGRLEKALDHLCAGNIPVGIVQKPESIFYLTGFYPSSSAVLLLRAEPLLLLSQMDGPRLGEVKGVKAKVVEKFEGDLKRLGPKAGAEKGTVSLAFYEKYLTGKEVVELDFLQRMRSVKDEREVRAIRRAIKVAEGAMGEVLESVKAGGESERSLAARAEYLIKGKAEVAFEAIVASGRNSTIPHHRPTDRTVRAGDTVIVDLGARVGHYNSDMTRTHVPPPAEELYEIVLEAQEAGIKECYAGNALKNADLAVRRVLREYGYEDAFLHSTGHGVGLEVHESPRLARDEKGRFEAGMVVTVEPGVYSKRFGVRIEDMVLVGPRPRVLSRFRK